MKLLAFSDIHGDKKAAKKLAQKARKEAVDLVVIAGDISHFDTNFNRLLGVFKDYGVEVAMVPGNHESMATVNFLTEKYGFKNLHYKYIFQNDVAIIGSGGAEIGPNPIQDEDIFYNINLHHKKLKGKKINKKIFVTHVHPAYSIMEKISFKGSPSLTKAIKEFSPDLVISGHVHEAEGLEDMIGSTKVITVGKHGKIIELEDEKA